jgi:hypothetical protein
LQWAIEESPLQVINSRHSKTKGPKHVSNTGSSVETQCQRNMARDCDDQPAVFSLDSDRAQQRNKPRRDDRPRNAVVVKAFVNRRLAFPKTKSAGDARVVEFLGRLRGAVTLRRRLRLG